MAAENVDPDKGMPVDEEVTDRSTTEEASEHHDSEEGEAALWLKNGQSVEAGDARELDAADDPGELGLPELRLKVKCLEQQMEELREQSAEQIRLCMKEVSGLRAQLQGVGQLFKQDLFDLKLEPPFTKKTAPAIEVVVPEAPQRLPIVEVAEKAPSTAAEAEPVAAAAAPVASGTALTEPHVVAAAAASISTCEVYAQELMAMLNVGAKPTGKEAAQADAEVKAAKSASGEPLSLSLDELCLWKMSLREDAELGADRHNEETFGSDAPAGWNFEQNLEANNRIKAKEAEVSESSQPASRPSFSFDEAASTASSQAGGDNKIRVLRLEESLRENFKEKEASPKVAPCSPYLETAVAMSAAARWLNWHQQTSQALAWQTMQLQ
eukprot:TRINITY_DN90895_c0_g1_i1.p1 TRINITY_DN90895_c0_g1~~TRINITY_DN90895_c0_g1_i1.p1  ORF type:complete len:415 (-),score=126.61 TRINITY_DN90895_c0_g1_i1:134-1279(-)